MPAAEGDHTSAHDIDLKNWTAARRRSARLATGHFLRQVTPSHLARFAPLATKRASPEGGHPEGDFDAVSGLRPSEPNLRNHACKPWVGSHAGRRMARRFTMIGILRSRPRCIAAAVDTVSADPAARAAGRAAAAADARAAGRAARTTRFLLAQAGLTVRDADSGAVTLIQRFGSAANLNIHMHCLVLDGVYKRNTESGCPGNVDVQPRICRGVRSSQGGPHATRRAWP